MRFTHLETIYREFDIRGQYPKQINETTVEKMGRALAHKQQLKTVAVGRDVRPSADALFNALSAGLTSQGARVVNLGLTTTPMTYFMANKPNIDATVMITASHMPANYNGLKITTHNGLPLSTEAIQTLGQLVAKQTFANVTPAGTVTARDIQNDWIEFFKKQVSLADASFLLVVDPANMVGILELPVFQAFAPHLTVHALNDTFDHTCPNHEANPVKTETLTQLSEAVVARGASLGVAFDGDADRVGLVDETGAPVAGDIMGLLLAKIMLQKHPPATVVHDTVSTRALPELITSLGGSALRQKVGSVHIKRTMRKHQAVLGIEKSGHIFFKDANYHEAGPLPVLLLLEHMRKTQQPLSVLVRAARKYHQSGEINSTIKKPVADIYQTLRATFPDATFSDFDGLSLQTDHWWCQLRPSANDPVLRLNMEADTPELMKTQTEVVLRIVRGD